MKLAGAVDLIPDLGAAKTASVLITISVREDQEEELVDRHRSTAFGAVKLRGLELIKIRLGFRVALTARCRA
jgi:hypothetical protein